MATERVTLQEALAQVDDIRPASRLLLLRVGVGDGDFNVRHINMQDKNDPVATFIAHQECILDGYIKSPDSIPVPRLDSHGRRRSIREMTDIRESRLESYKFELAVLRGTIIAPLTLIEKTTDEDGFTRSKIVGYSIRRDPVGF